MRLDHLTRRQRKTTINMIYMHAGCALASAFIPYDHIHVPTVTIFFCPSPAASLTGRASHNRPAPANGAPIGYHFELPDYLCI